MNSPQKAIEIALALNGREFAMLTELELRLYRFFRDHGRKYGITVDVEVTNSCDQIEDEIKAASRSQQEDIYRRERTQIGVGFAGSAHRWGLGSVTEVADPHHAAELLCITPERYDELSQHLQTSCY